eukprot:TRINITY_DN10997_c0_g1_i1.p1 TRINITY_DN10997_c0_g1~~TRINITY_DN10997_c0_g1_i1.p1  ORF type:complete len:257 (-),score=44.68 TRINITY_DN10997_c0_g1_i1:54-824(-)
MLRRVVPRLFALQKCAFRSSPPRFSLPDPVQHRKDWGDENQKFEFTPESYKKIESVLKKFPANRKQSAVIYLLYIAQEQNDNWIPLAAMNKIAQLLAMPPVRVYEVATFYTMFNRKPVGKVHIQLCGTTPCQLCGSEAVRDAISKHFHVHVGETNAEKTVTLWEVECLGACVNAPMMQVNNKYFYEFLTPEKAIKIVEDLIAGKPVKTNNQNHVFSCEGPLGQTTLKGPEIVDPPCRDFAALKAKQPSPAAPKPKA